MVDFLYCNIFFCSVVSTVSYFSHTSYIDHEITPREILNENKTLNFFKSEKSVYILEEKKIINYMIDE